MPLVQEARARQAPRGLSAVGIAIHIPEEIEREAVRAFVAEAGIKFPIFQVDDPSYDRLESLARSLGGPGLVLPTVFVVDERGRIMAIFSGKEVLTLPDALPKLLKQPYAPRASKVGLSAGYSSR